MIPTPGQPLSEADVSPCTDCDGTGITTQSERPCSCSAGDAYRPHAPVSRPGDGVEWENMEASAWRWLSRLYPNDAPADLAYDANEMVDAFVAGAGEASRMAKALWRIGEERQYRAGYCQTDFAVEPALTAEEAQAVAREALSPIGPALTPPAEPVSRPAGEGEREALARLIRERIGRDFDGECHLTEGEAYRIIALLRPAAPGGGWQPIETAPKDGESILAICATAYSPVAGVTWWNEGWTHYSRPDEKWHGGVGRWFPTHWMPLPQAPAQPAAVEGAEYAPITVRSYSVARTTPADDALRVAVEALEKIEDLPAAGTPEHIAAAIASEALAEIAALKAGGVK